MLERPAGLILLAVALFAGGLAGIAMLWAVWPRDSNTSPLAAMVAVVWSCTYIFSALLTWRRSRLAGPAFLAAMGLLVPPAWLLIPGSSALSLLFSVFTFVVAVLGYRYLARAREPMGLTARR